MKRQLLVPPSFLTMPSVTVFFDHAFHDLTMPSVMHPNFHAVVSSVVERQGLAVAARVVVGAVVPSASEVVVVVEVAGVEAAVVGNKQLDKISKCLIIDHVNSNIIGQSEFCITWRTLHGRTWVWCLSFTIRLLSCSRLLELLQE
jgi:hypothetical protein